MYFSILSYYVYFVIFRYLIVGQSGTGKNAVMSFCSTILSSLEEFTSKSNFYKLPHFFSEDTTFENIFRILRENNGTLTVACDEMDTIWDTFNVTKGKGASKETSLLLRLREGAAVYVLFFFCGVV